MHKPEKGFRDFLHRAQCPDRRSGCSPGSDWHRDGEKGSRFEVAIFSDDADWDVSLELHSRQCDNFGSVDGNGDDDDDSECYRVCDIEQSYNDKLCYRNFGSCGDGHAGALARAFLAAIMAIHNRGRGRR